MATTNSLAGILARSASTTEFFPATASCAAGLRSNLLSPLCSELLNSFFLNGFPKLFRSSRLKLLLLSSFGPRLSLLRLSLFSGRATADLSILLPELLAIDLLPLGRSLRALPGFINNSTLDH